MNGSACGFGYAQGTDFNCNSSICYGIGTRQGQFETFQQLLNQILLVTGGNALKVDGFVGADTLAGAMRVARAIIQAGLPGSDDVNIVTLANDPSVTKEQLAGMVDSLLPMLAISASSLQAQRIAAGLPPTGAAATGPLPAPSAMTPGTIAPGMGPAPAAAATGPLPAPSAMTPGTIAPGTGPAPAAMKSTTWYIIGGVAAAVLAAGGAAYVIYRRKGHGSARSGHRYARAY
jgi:hypothetical protein